MSLKQREGKSTNIIGEELNKLKKALPLGEDLQAKWIPSETSKLDGEVKEGVIYIYAGDEAKAVDIVRHEYIDFAISRPILMYQKVTNSLISLINQLAYAEKERLVENLKQLYEKNSKQTRR